MKKSMMLCVLLSLVTVGYATKAQDSSVKLDGVLKGAKVGNQLNAAKEDSEQKKTV